MFDINKASLLFTAKTWKQATKLVDEGGVTGLTLDEDNYPLVRIKANVRVNYYGIAFWAYVDFWKDTVTEYDSYYYSIRSLKESVQIAALLIHYFRLQKRGIVRTYDENYLPTSYMMERGLRQLDVLKKELPYTQHDLFIEAFKGIHRNDKEYTTYRYDEHLENAFPIELRIGRIGQKGYVVKNISDLLCDIIYQRQYKAGKQLDVVLCRDSFEPSYLKLVDFLIGLYRGDDLYQEQAEYGSRGNIGRQLYLRGKYLDDFMDALGNRTIFVKGDKENYKLPVVDGEIKMYAFMKKLRGGYTLTMQEKQVYFGAKYNYVDDDYNLKIIRMPYDTEMVELLMISQNLHGVEQNISQEDMPRFTKLMWPLLEKYADVDRGGFLPEAYLPPKPAYEIYLDMPQENTIVCEVYAVYKDGTKYNVFDRDSIGDSRNEEDEKQMDQIVSSRFNSFDPKNHRMILMNDDDKLYDLLTNGIPYFQSIAKVFISDALKKLTVKKMNRVQVGVSVNHDLLQLNLSEDKRTLEELAEILSKYEPKKKYYRLKNGAFITVEHDALDQLHQLTEDLELTAKDIKAGETEIPKYRALYIDKVAEENLEIDRDSYFRELIDQVKEVENTQYHVPKSLQKILRDYQVNGYRWLKSLQTNGFGGLLADEMGLGKSVQVIALIQSIPKRGRVLIVCPASLVYNWKAEFEKFAPELPVTMVTGNIDARVELINGCKKDEILITSYDALKRDVDLYIRKKFDVQIIDEAQYIKNANTLAATSVKEIKAKFKIALTGTPIENRLSELWSIFDYLMPGFLYSYNRFRRVFETPIVKDQDNETKERLRKMIAPFVLRRLKKDVLKDLPDKLEESMIAPLEGEQKALYDARKQRLKIMLASQSSKEFNENKIAVLAELTKLRQICCDPALIYNDYQGNSAKEEMCINLIQQAIDEGHKILLFSQFTSMLDRLIVRLKENDIRYHLLTGSTKKEDRAKMVEKFQNDDVPLFLISLKAGGTGLNLTAADIVIHYDPWWNTAVENQATDRAHRIGQENIVTVYRLIMKDTIEERIIELQTSKADLANEIFSGEEMSSSKLTREQLLEIL